MVGAKLEGRKHRKRMWIPEERINLDCAPKRLHGGSTFELCLGGCIGGTGWGVGDGGNFPSKQKNSVYTMKQGKEQTYHGISPRLVTIKVFSPLSK